MMRVGNSTIAILNARNAIITADANNAIKTSMARKPPDRYMIHFPPGASVHIDPTQSRNGTYRVLSVLGSNLAMRLDRRLVNGRDAKPG